jgi:AraC-like DNA-binding protein
MGSTVRINLCGVVRCEPQWQWDPTPERIGDHDLWYAWAGGGTIRIDGAEYPVHRGRLFILRPNAEIHARHDRQRRLGVCYIHFDPPRQMRAESLPLACDVTDADLFERMLRRVVELVERGQKQAAECLLESVLLALPQDIIPAGESARPARLRDARIAEAMRHIRENPGEIHSVESLADRVSYAPDHFTRLFKQIAGVAPKEYCIRARIERAQELLRASGMSVQQIASALGYADIYFFSRQFKARTGLSPTQYRTSGR